MYNSFEEADKWKTKTLYRNYFIRKLIENFCVEVSAGGITFNHVHFGKRHHKHCRLIQNSPPVFSCMECGKEVPKGIILLGHSLHRKIVGSK
jgi:hypothetical protein